MFLSYIKVKRFQVSMFSCTTREVAFHDILIQSMLWNGTEFFHILQNLLYHFHFIL